MEVEVNGVILECVEGDISFQEGIDVVVNAANAELRPGSGVAGVIHREAGPDLYEECKDHAPIETGEAVITRGYDLPNDWVVHCLGPIYDAHENADELLSQCYRRALQLAEDKEVDSIAFPAISTGAFGYPIVEAAKVAIETVVDMTPELNSIDLVRFVLYDQSDYDVYEKILSMNLEG